VPGFTGSAITLWMMSPFSTLASPPFSAASVIGCQTPGVPEGDPRVAAAAANAPAPSSAATPQRIH